jgi:hypothetical protein
MPAIDSAVRLVESIFAHEVGTTGFNIIVGVCVLTWVLVARVFMAMFDSKRGIIAAFFALIVPLALGLIAYGMAELHAVPLAEYKWVSRVIPWTGFGLFLLLAVVVIARRIWALSAGVSLFIYLVASGAAIGAYFGVQVIINVVDFGEEQMQQRDQRVNDELDQLL